MYYLFLMCIIFKAFTEFVTILLLLFMLWFFGHEACGILVPWSGIKCTHSTLEEVSIIEPPRKFPSSSVSIPLLMDTGCVHVLAILNSATVNTGGACILKINFKLIFSGYMPRSGIAGSYCNSIFSGFFFFLLGTSILFSIVAVPIYIPTNSIGGFPFLHTLSSIYCL